MAAGEGAPFIPVTSGVSDDFSSEIREARGFFERVTPSWRLDYAETGAPWRETGEASRGGFQRSLGESLAPRGRDVLRLQQSLRTAPSVLGLMHTRDAIS